MRYIMPVNDETKKIYKNLFNQPLTLRSNRLRIIKTNEDNTFDIKYHRHLNRVVDTPDDYNSMLKLTDEELGIEISLEEFRKLSKKENVAVYDTITNSSLYKRMDNLKNEYYLLDLKFKKELEIQQYYKLLLIKSSGNNYTIEPCPNKENLQIILLDNALRRIDLFSGVYLCVDASEIDEDIEEYLSCITRDDGYNYQIQKSPVFLMPYIEEDRLSLTRSLDYMTLINNSRTVYYKKVGNSYSIYPMDASIDNLINNGYKVGHIINPHTLYEYMDRQNRNREIASRIIHLNRTSEGLIETTNEKTL